MLVATESFELGVDNPILVRSLELDAQEILEYSFKKWAVLVENLSLLLMGCFMLMSVFMIKGWDNG